MTITERIREAERALAIQRTQGLEVAAAIMALLEIGFYAVRAEGEKIVAYLEGVRFEL